MADEDLGILDSGGRARDFKSVKRAETAFVAWWMRETGFLPAAKDLLRASRLPVGYVTLRHCFYAQQIVDNLPQNGSLNALEIGAGGGALKQLLRALAGDRFGHYVIVDLPQMLCMSIGACMAFQPDEPLAIADGPEVPYPLDARHIFVPAGAVAGLEAADITFDLTVNTHSFQEMDDTIVAEYFGLIYKKAAKGGLFFNTNWRQSQMTRLDGSTYDNDPANYPYHAGDEVLFHAPDPLHQTLRERWNLKALIDTRTSIRRIGVG